MKTSNLFARILLLLATAYAGVANAAPTIGTLTVQGYMKQASGAAVTDGTYVMDVGVLQNSVGVWGQHLTTVNVSGGLFTLTLSGNGDDLSGCSGCTNFNTNFSTGPVSLAPGLLDATGSVSVRVYVETAINGHNPLFDISVGAAPTAFVAAIANTVSAGSITLASIGTSSYVQTWASTADANKIVVTNGTTGLIDPSMIPANNNTTYSGNNTFSGGSTFSGNLTSSGTSTFSGPATFSGTGTALSVTHDASVGGVLTTLGLTSTGTAALATATATSLTVSGTSSLGAITGTTLSVSGTSSLAAVTASGTLAVSGTSVFAGVTNSANETVAGNLTVSGTSTFAGVSMSGGQAMSGSLVVGGTSSFAGASAFSSNLAVSGTTTFSGPIVANSTGTAGQALAFVSTSAAPVWSSKVSSINIVTPTNGATYTTPSNLMFAIVEVVAGGGAGGGSPNTVLTAGGGGGGGGYIKALCTPSQIGASQTVTVGAAGAASSFGTLLTTTAGAAGTTAVTTKLNVAGGTGGTAANGGTCTTILIMNGSAGQPGVGGQITSAGNGGSGGNSALGMGADALFTATNANGNNAPTGFGGGGGGAFSDTAGGVKTGGTAGAGKVIITEYLF